LDSSLVSRYAAPNETHPANTAHANEEKTHKRKKPVLKFNLIDIDFLQCLTTNPAAEV
jgi:hypothetical protein